MSFTPFPDVELVVIAALSTLEVTGLQVATKVPVDPNGTYSWLPFLRVSSRGGADDKHTDTSKVDVDAFAATKSAASELAEQARALLIYGPITTAAGVMDGAVTDTSPNQVPYGNEEQVIRYTAAYTVATRRSY